MKTFNFKLVALVLFLVFAVIAIGSGLYLTSRSQDTRSRASEILPTVASPITVSPIRPISPTPFPNATKALYIPNESYVSITDSANNVRLHPTSTIEFWFKPEVNQRNMTSQSILFRNTTSGNYKDIFDILHTPQESSAGYIKTRLEVKVGESYRITELISLNSWHHIGIVRSGTTMKLYLDGQLKETHTLWTSGVIPQFPESKMYLGANVFSFGTNLQMQGALDDIRISNGITRDVSAIWNQGGYQLGRITADSYTVAFWRFEGNLNDSSPKRVNGVSSGPMSYVSGISSGSPSVTVGPTNIPVGWTFGLSCQNGRYDYRFSTSPSLTGHCVEVNVYENNTGKLTSMWDGCNNWPGTILGTAGTTSSALFQSGRSYMMTGRVYSYVNNRKGQLVNSTNITKLCGPGGSITPTRPTTPVPTRVGSPTPTKLPTATPTAVPGTSKFWSYNLSCLNGKYNYKFSTVSPYTYKSNHCVELTERDNSTGTVRSKWNGCSTWPQYLGGSGATGASALYQTGKTYTMTGKIYQNNNGVKGNLLVNESWTQSCAASASQTPSPSISL